MPDVLCLGEILVDWVCTVTGAELADAEQFTKAPGGAPANTAVGLARQKISSGFVGRVSADQFGKWLKDVLTTNGVDTTSTIEDRDAQTRMAYVVTTADGDRKLAEFSRIACADARLSVEDLDEDQFAHAQVLHFGSISLIDEPAKSATLKAVELARKHGLLVSYDPNIRLSLWPSEQFCKKAIEDTLGLADIVKINEDELEFLTGKRHIKAAEQLRTSHGITILLVTLDHRGALVCSEKGSKEICGFDIELKEATGAGDGFNAGVLAGILIRLKQTDKNRIDALQALELAELEEITKRGNAIGALTCTRAGAIPALPSLKELDDFLLDKTAKSSNCV